MKRKKLPYIIRLIRVSLKWTWRALMIIPKEIISGTAPISKKERQYR